MRITLSPVRLQTSLSVIKLGNTLVLNGVPVDLATYDAAVAPCPWILGQPYQLPDWRITLILPHGANAPEETRFPVPITVMTDGPVDLPPYDVVEEFVPPETWRPGAVEVEAEAEVPVEDGDPADDGVPEIAAESLAEVEDPAEVADPEADDPA